MGFCRPCGEVVPRGTLGYMVFHYRSFKPFSQGEGQPSFDRGDEDGKPSPDLEERVFSVLQLTPARQSGGVRAKALACLGLSCLVPWLLFPLVSPSVCCLLSQTHVADPGVAVETSRSRGAQSGGGPPDRELLFRFGSDGSQEAKASLLTTLWDEHQEARRAKLHRTVKGRTSGLTKLPLGNRDLDKKAEVTRSRDKWVRLVVCPRVGLQDNCFGKSLIWGLNLEETPTYRLRCKTWPGSSNLSPGVRAFQVWR